MFSVKPQNIPEEHRGSNTINALGYKGALPDKDFKAGNEKRVFVLGGSTVYNGTKPIPLLLETEFKNNGYNNIKISNFGIPASITRQDMIRVLIEISEYKPDLIIMYSGFNDIQRIGDRPGYPQYFIYYENNPLWTRNVSEYKLIPFLLYGSHLLRYLFPAYFEKVFIENKQSYEMLKNASTRTLDQESIRIYLKSLYQTSQIATDLRAEFIAFFQPMQCMYEGFCPTMREYNTLVDIKARTLIEREKYQSDNFKFIDISGIFPKSKKDIFFTDGVHINPKSRKVVAKEMYKHIIKLHAKKLGIKN